MESYPRLGKYPRSCEGWVIETLPSPGLPCHFHPLTHRLQSGRPSQASWLCSARVETGPSMTPMAAIFDPWSWERMLILLLTSMGVVGQTLLLQDSLLNNSIASCIANYLQRLFTSPLPHTGTQTLGRYSALPRPVRTERQVRAQAQSLASPLWPRRSRRPGRDLFCVCTGLARYLRSSGRRRLP